MPQSCDGSNELHDGVYPACKDCPPSAPTLWRTYDFERPSLLLGQTLICIMTTYKELLAQRAELDQQIAAAQKLAAKQALEEVRATIQEFGFTAQQVFPWTPEKKKAPAKYMDPNTGKTWSGRGKMPKWLQGQDLTQFAV